VRTHPLEKKLALVMVGLPARGKSFTARKIERYMTWLGYRTRAFNLGEYRRERFPGHQPHAFFDPDNTASREVRETLAHDALEDMIGWLDTEGSIAIYDATNTGASNHQRCRVLTFMGLC
jgi:hypothetical protein